MGNNASESDRDRIGRFWSRYIKVNRAFGIPQKAQPWYHKQVERFIDAHPDLRLADHSEESVADWQLRQRADSLRLFFAHPGNEAASFLEYLALKRKVTAATWTGDQDTVYSQVVG